MTFGRVYWIKMCLVPLLFETTYHLSSSRKTYMITCRELVSAIVAFQEGLGDEVVNKMI